MQFYLELFIFLFHNISQKCTTWKLEILRPVCTHVIIMCSLSKEHLLLAPEARLGSRALRSEMPTLLVSPVAGLTAQVSMCLICVGACAAGGQGLAFMGLLFLWGGCDREGDILAPSLRSWYLTGSE